MGVELLFGMVRDAARDTQLGSSEGGAVDTSGYQDHPHERLQQGLCDGVFRRGGNRQFHWEQFILEDFLGLLRETLADLPPRTESHFAR